MLIIDVIELMPILRLLFDAAHTPYDADYALMMRLMPPMLMPSILFISIDDATPFAAYCRYAHARCLHDIVARCCLMFRFFLARLYAAPSR